MKCVCRLEELTQDSQPEVQGDDDNVAIAGKNAAVIGIP